jgi:hypothetical protein
MGLSVTQLVKALRYKPEVSGFDGVIGIFFDIILPAAFDPRVSSFFKRNEYQKYFLASKCGGCVGLTILQHYCTDCLEIWDPQLPGNLRASKGIALLLPILYTCPYKHIDFKQADNSCVGVLRLQWCSLKRMILGSPLSVRRSSL